MTKLLIESGSDVNAQNSAKNTPLHWAAWSGKLRKKMNKSTHEMTI